MLMKKSDFFRKKAKKAEKSRKKMDELTYTSKAHSLL